MPVNDQDDPQLVGEAGAWHFVSCRHYRHTDGSIEARYSRHLRKHFQREPLWREGLIALLTCWWMPKQLNWWIGVVFAVGAALFILASLLFLIPEMAVLCSVSEAQANGVFFLGSIPFTVAAYLQLFQAANAESLTGQPREGKKGYQYFGWRPRELGWLSCALQFLGTLLFNINTFDALQLPLNWLQQDFAIWVPNVLGSLLFLSSGYLAFIEICHARWAWQAGHMSWWIGLINLLGCVAFMCAAIFALVLPQAPAFDAVTLSLIFTLLGAAAFLLGALLLLPETAAAKIS
jgi:hypothetical protein